MWTHRASIDTKATPATVWSIFERVDEWPKWNAGIAAIALDGPFAAGSTFTMDIPNGPRLVSTLIDVTPFERFTDETVVGETRVVVHHLIEPRATGTRIVYATEIAGPDAVDVGPLVTGDFGTVLVALKERAERL